MIYRARYLVTMQGPAIPWGCVRVQGDRVVEIGALEELHPEPGENVTEISDTILMPGLINAHCHLELGMARGRLPCGEAFPMWVSRLRKALEGATPETYGQSARLGALECMKNGTTSVVDVGNSGESLRELASLPIRSFPYLELIGLDPSVAKDRFDRASQLLASLPKATELYNPGLTGHAPYSCSIELLRSAAAADRRGGPYTLHVAESAEEMAMFREGRGALYEFCLRIFPGLKEERCPSPIRFLSRHGLIPKGSLFAHCNFADAEDIRILHDTETSVVHCPRSRAFFNHPDFPLDALRAAGINLCLGTDSLASNEGLSMFDEMAEFRRNHPHIPCRDILAMATLNGAKALGREGELGCLKPGCKADFIAIGLRHHPEYDIYEEIVGEAHEVFLVVVGGEEVVS